MANLNPKPEDVAPKVPDLRSLFAEKYADSISSGAYEQRDVERFEKDDAYARCFLRTMGAKDDVTKAVDVIDQCFLFRKEYQLWDTTDASFPADRLEHGKSACYYRHSTKEGHLILYIDVKANNVGPAELTGLKKYIAYSFEQHHRKNPETMCVVLMDMYGASTSNVRMDITRFIITCFTTYFPAYLAYMLIYEMPFLISASWKVMSAFLSSEQKQKMRQVNKKSIKEYLDPDQMWPHMH